MANVKRALDFIGKGDIYQVNLSRQILVEWSGHPADMYLQFRHQNPAPFAGYFDLGDGRAILSCSPERFIQVENRSVRTFPIKGTRPRGSTPETDRQLARELIESEKDRAELAMIVDVLRNDLGRVCSRGSIQVTDHAALRTFPSVHHLVSTVTGTLPEGVSPTELIRSAFPGGSITGAPKIRAMEIIDELESMRRGPYTGSIAWFDSRGNMDSNILIRTAIVHDSNLAFPVGGGIVAESDPQDEWEETVAKTGGIEQVLSTPIHPEERI
jgi:para-aminobenzoate synthetase component 1